MTVHDTVFRNALLVDGTGAEGRLADVAVDGQRITAVTAPRALKARREIDATGRVLSPGFVDIHSHADHTILVDGRAHSSTTQGVTSIVTGNCGLGAGPLGPQDDDRWKYFAGGVHLDMLDGTDSFGDFGEYLGSIRERGTGVNVFPLVPHGILRAGIAGFEDRELTTSELDTLRGRLEDCLDAGGIGMSTGLEYAPGQTATTAELKYLAKTVGARSGLYASHCRNRGDFIREAAAEAVEIAESSGSRLQLSHFIRRPTGPSKGLAAEAMQIVRDAKSRGVGAYFDTFPFEYGPTPLSFVIPQHLRDGLSSTELAQRLSEQSFIDRVLAEMNPRFIEMLNAGIAADMYISDDGADGATVGLTLGQLADQRHQDVAEAAIRLLSDSGINFSAVNINERWADWVDLEDALGETDYLIMGDGMTGGLDGPLSDHGFALSDWGYATRMIQEFVRERKSTTLASAIKRMTSLPAEQAGLKDRGRIAEGWFADLVLFDLDTIGWGGGPDNIPAVSTGIDYVMVNGVFVIDEGKATSSLPGVVAEN